jgi:hypothetical protein
MQGTTREEGKEMTEHRLLKLARRHLEAEYSGSVDATLDTLADDIVYEHPFYQHMVSGKDKMRGYYLRRWAEAPLVRAETKRYWICGDDTIIMENGPFSDGPDRETTLIILTFRGDELVRELSYSPANLESHRG